MMINIEKIWRYSVYEGESGGIVFANTKEEAMALVKKRYDGTMDPLDNFIEDTDILVWPFINDDWYDERFPNVIDCYGF